MNLKLIFTERRFWVTLVLGFSSGLPLALAYGTMKAWFTKGGLPLDQIGNMALATLPYTLKFLWAPLMDRFIPPFLGRRRGWILLCQLFLCICISSLVFFTPATFPKTLFVIACIIAFFSASQDIAIDAYRIDLLPHSERPIGAAMWTSGYRIAMLVSGGLALVIADFFGWQVMFITMVFLLIGCTIATLMGPEPAGVMAPQKQKMWDFTVLPFLDFLTRPKAVWILIFITIYKLGDIFAGTLTPETFLLREIEFSLSVVGTLVKFSGFFATIGGAIAGAYFVSKIGLFRCLLLFGILQAASNLTYMLLLWTGPNYLVAGSAVFVENFCAGMGNAAFMVLLMNLCNVRFSASQYALLSSLTALIRPTIGPLAGYIANEYGWSTYFTISILFAIPGLLLLFYIKGNIEKMEKVAEEKEEKEEALPAAG